MAQGKLDDLVARLRRLPPEELRRVERVVDAIEAEEAPARGFERLCGVVQKQDADAMMAAIAECERINPRDW